MYVCVYIHTYICVLKINCSVILPPLGRLSSTAAVVQSSWLSNVFFPTCLLITMNTISMDVWELLAVS